MKELIQDLEQKKADAQNLVNDYTKAILTLKKVCTHRNKDGSDAFEYEGHDSHNNYEKCSICGTSRKN